MKSKENAMSAECKIIKAIAFKCENCESFHVVQPLWEESSDETGYSVWEDYIKCDDCGWLNRIFIQKGEWEKMVK
jgi:RNase P subunit RPR2